MMKIVLTLFASLLLLQACNNSSSNSSSNISSESEDLNTSYRELVRDIFADDANDLPRIINDLSIVEDASDEDFSDLL